jgi:hypothetical protein
MIRRVTLPLSGSSRVANKWDLEKSADPTGWCISEKLDVVWYVSAGRVGNRFTPPRWLSGSMTPFPPGSVFKY